MSTLNFARSYSPEFGITCLRLWNLAPEQMSAPQREKNTFILDEIRRTFDYGGSLDHRDFSYRDVRLAEHTYLSFDHEFRWPSPDAPDFGPDGTCHGLKSHIEEPLCRRCGYRTRFSQT